MSEFNINEDAQSGGEYSGSQSSNPNQDPQPSESAFPDEEEDTITMLDVIEQENKLEEEASAVLGNSDEKNCTYPRGYIARQALYSCATCSDDPENMAAICLACSLECHDNHEVIELYTKRGYRCDCGNSKFKPDFVCKLDKQTKKAPINEQNKYNHNFSGKYCKCDKRYPPDENDTSAESQDEMWQCIVCEDWYHTKHLGVKDLPSKFDELICGSCVEKLDFVHYYRDFINISLASVDTETRCETNNNSEDPQLTTVDKDSTDKLSITNGCEQASSTPTTDENSPTKVSDQDSKPHSATSQQAGNTEPNVTEAQGPNAVISESDTNDSQLENKDPSKAGNSESPTISVANASAEDECLLEKYKKLFELDSGNDTGVSTSVNQSKTVNKGAAIFWTDCSWRSRLCRCANCILMYKSKGCEYLIDEKDTVQYYEAQGRAIVRESSIERGMSALNQMNRTAVVEALHGYDELKADLSTYLRKFAETKKVVREEDIHDFFAQLKSKKRPRLEYE